MPDHVDNVKILSTTIVDHPPMSEPEPYHHGDLANALLGAVEEIVGESGASGVTLREAARRAGVSHSAPAHHFGDKDGLMEAFGIQGWEMLADALQTAALETEGAPHRVQLTAMGRAYLEFAMQHPSHYEVMMRMMDDCEDPSAPIHQAADAAFLPLAVFVGRTVQDGIVTEQRSRYFATILWGMVHGIAHLWESDRLPHFYNDHTPDQFVDGVLETMTSLIFGD